MKAALALDAATRINLVYQDHQSKAGNIEFGIFHIDGNVVYSVKGTHRNKESGTISLIRDVVSDIRFLPRRNYETRAWQPGGFLDAGQELADYIARKQKKSEPICFEGHSLGGAACLIAADILIRRGFNVQRVIVLGAPKTGRLRFVDQIEILSLKAGADVVCELPPMYWSIPVTTIGQRGGRITDHFLVSSYIDKLLVIGRETDL